MDRDKFRRLVFDIILWGNFDHIGENEDVIYQWKAMNKLFDEYDVVLARLDDLESRVGGSLD